MNGSMIEHNGLGITYFTLIFLKTWLLVDMLEYLSIMSKLDYCFEPYRSPNVHATKKRIYDEFDS